MPLYLPIKLDPNDKAQWLTALRSGNYIQGRLLLRSASNKYCCLGVWCDLRDPGGWESSPPYTDFLWRDDLELLSPGYDPALDQLTNHCGGTASVRKYLADMNDGGASFDAIADWIETNL